MNLSSSSAAIVDNPKTRGLLPLLAIITALLLTSAIFLLLLPIAPTFSSSSIALLPCSLPASHPVTSTLVANAILHYATSSVTPQQTESEVRLTLDALRARGGPCNFLVFGLGYDSLMWASFNAGGATLFLEEDPKWVKDVLRNAPSLVARSVKYPTHLREADHLLASYMEESSCLPANASVKGSRRCPLALPDLPEEVFGREWDVIMIDAPRGYFPEAPGRMGAIWSAAVMARNRKGEGYTDVFLHDVNRKVEENFALEFLCRKYLVNGVQRLWHFRIPPVRNDGNSAASGDHHTFC